MAQCILHSCVSKHQGLLHKFPSDQKLRRIWFKSINKRRKANPNWITGVPYLCENHFRRDDYRFVPGCNTGRKLKPNAIPTIFRRTCYTKSQRVVVNPYEVDSFEHFKEYFAKHVDASTLAMYNVKITDKFVSFFKLTFTDGVASVKVNIAISDQLDVSVYIHDEMVYPSNLYWVIPKTGKLTKFKQLDILLRYYREGNQVIVRGQSKYLQNLEMAHYFINNLLIDCKSQEPIHEGKRISKLLSLLQDQVTSLMAQDYPDEAIEFAEELLGISHRAYDIAKNLIDLPDHDMSTDESDDESDVVFVDESSL